MRVSIPKAVLWGGVIASLPRDGRFIDEDCLEQAKNLLIDVAYSFGYIERVDTLFIEFRDNSELRLIDPYQTKGPCTVSVESEIEITEGDEE